MNEKKISLSDAIDQVKINYPPIARQLFACYRELVEAGFSEVQAFQIIITWGISTPMRPL
jgi:hypothetical protein